jgi:ATP-binding cassette subfamily B (MDR/TAP) protein 1
MIVGTIGAIGNGLGLPLMTLLFGEMIDSFGSNQSNIDDVVQQVSKVT